MPINDEYPVYEVSYAVIEAATGIIVKTGTCAIDDLSMQIVDGQDVIAPIPEGIADDTHRWDGVSFVDLPARPGAWAVWTGAEWTDPRTPADLAAEHEAAMDVLRAERDRRLTASDWTQIPDTPLTDEQRTAWRDYRSALRDLPSVTIDPSAPAWPEQPTT